MTTTSSIATGLGLATVLMTSLLIGLPSSGLDDNPCSLLGCKTQNEVMSNVQGGSNTCGITSVNVSQGPVQGVNDDGACNCEDGDCKRVEGSTCQASCVFTVIVTGGSGYKFCHESDQNWQTTGNTATITLTSAVKDCSQGGAAAAEASVFIQCGSCGALALNVSAWLVTVRSQCYGCPGWNQDC